MKRYDDDIIHALGATIIVGLALWAAYTIISVTYAHGTKVETRMCVTESGNKRVPCPETNDE